MRKIYLQRIRRSVVNREKRCQPKNPDILAEDSRGARVLASRGQGSSQAFDYKELELKNEFDCTGRNALESSALD